MFNLGIVYGAKVGLKLRLAKHVLNSIYLMRSCGTFVNVEATPDSNDNRLTDITLF